MDNMGKDKLPIKASSNRFNVVVKETQQTFSCSTSATLLQALTDGGIFMEANCGGRGTCGKCKLQVPHGQVIYFHGASATYQHDHVHLACQIYPVEDVTVSIATSEASRKGNIIETFESNDQSLVKKLVITLTYPTLENQYSFQEMISCRLLSSIPILWGTRVMQQLAEIVKLKPDIVTVVMFDNEIIAIEAGDTACSLFGVAFDIGTTTVAGMLVDVNRKKIIATHSQTNPQAAFGADVISRINATLSPDGLAAEASVIRQCLNQIIEELCTAMQVPQHQIYATTIVGNSTMEHLLMGISPLSFASNPYASVFTQIAPFYPNEISISMNPYGRIALLPNIMSFIGGDTTAAIIATNQDVSSNHTLLVDLGTNGEIVLGNREKLFACSTAAGPGFEGAHIRDGMRAFSGAIEDVVIRDDVHVKIMGGGKATGICGSGIVKGIAELVNKQIITASGRFDRKKAATLPVNLAKRLKNKDNQWEFVLIEGQDSATGRDISITQNDVRQIQLIKSAVCTGIQILLAEANLEGDIPVFLAGAFGNFIDIESALSIGLLPACSRGMVRSVGNAAGVGAVHALLSKEKLDRCTSIAKNIHYVELANHPQFHKTFLANLVFPEVRI